MSKSNAQKAVVSAWTEFARELMEAECPVQLFRGLKPSEFGEQMGKLIARDGSVNSVLWDSVVPSGTEDRTWVRAWLHMRSVPQFKDFLGSLDGAHAKHCVEKLRSVE